jgi:hypothetical protein
VGQKREKDKRKKDKRKKRKKSRFIKLIAESRVGLSQRAGE